MQNEIKQLAKRLPGKSGSLVKKNKAGIPSSHADT